jgi:hypothetical protein
MRINTKRNHNIAVVLSAVVVSTSINCTNLFAQSGLVRVFSMNTESLVRSQREAASGNKAVLASVKRLQKDADKVLGLKLVSVMDKNVVAQSSDKHDYLSLSRYWWPDPSKPDGLPYIQRDGETNPEVESVSDHENLQQVIKSVHTLGLAYFFTRKEDYAERAAEILKTWFLNADTKMNPNMNFGQIVKGKDVGRASGLIDVRGFALLIDGVGLLGGSKSWTSDDQKALVAWFTEYLNWLQTSKIAQQEAGADNNHGVWFDVQRASIAMFVGNASLARTILEEAKKKRIAQQIEPDGTQPRELARTRSMHYTAFNLEAFFTLALIGDQVGVDLWNYKSPDGRSIRKALDWFLPYYVGDDEWTHKQIDEFKKDGFFPELLLATTKFGDTKFAEAGRKFAGDKAKTDRANLIFGN